MLPPSLRHNVLAILSRHLGSRRYRVYLFGSRARGTANERSDYDFGIQAESPLELATLGKLRGELDELPVLQRIEVVDLAAASPDFVQRALVGAKLLDER
jgi:predicted nucleotidyltransferase